ncbi:PAS domain-containing protein [Microvirga sp. CF3062]|uniref:PAS domain-containing protein n=1 Tax=Microvirga sp. CF3062 TaxID=3110182 RepID=UPI002E79B325|nr:PAS domain-containing protein [Microvirga sp. CF3062]MEE1654738.1 PAS domain-containing protein [Microvirga sp. CF3062]
MVHRQDWTPKLKPPGSKPRLPSLRVRLLLIVFALLIPTFAAAVLALYTGYYRDRQEIQKHLLETGRALSLVLDRQFGQAEALLWALAASPVLQTKDHAAFDALARRATRMPDAWVVVEELGRQVVNTRLPPGAALPELPVQDHWKGITPGQVRVSNLFTGVVAKQPTVGIDTLVTLDDGSPRYVSVIMPAPVVARIFSDQRLPPAWIGAIVDRNGTMVARSRNPEPFVGKPVSTENVRRIQSGLEQGVFEGTSLDGEAVVLALARSPSSGWSTIVALPNSEFDAGARDLAFALAAAGSVLLALGAALAFHVTRRITRPVEVLARDALALQDGGFAEPLRSTGVEFRETSVLRHALESTREVLRQQKVERDEAYDRLREVKESLALRVEERTRELETANASFRESQVALADREALYAGVFRFSADGIFVFKLSSHGGIVAEACNPVVEHLIGKPSADIVGRQLRDILPPDQWPVLEARVRDCLTSGHLMVYEQNHAFPARQGVWMTTLVPIREGDEPVVRVLGSLRDITHEKETETELRQSRDKYSTLFEHSPFNLAVIGVYPNDRFVYEDANSALLKSLGFARDGFVGRMPQEIFAPETANHVSKHYRTCVVTKSIMDFEVTGKVPIGEVTRRTVLVPLLDEQGQVTKIFVTSIDLTEQRRMEEQLRQAQRLEAVGQLTGGIAHDFNNLLTVVMGNLDMLRRAKPDRAPRLIDNAINAVEHGRKLTSQLLAFSRRQPLKPEIVDLKDLIGGMGDMLAQSLRGDITLEIDFAEDLWPVEVDPAQLQAVLINLAANARDAMPKGGRFTVCVRNTISHNDGLAEFVSIEVSDTGTGIAPEVLQKVFEPFFTTKPVGRGTGLGLAQVYGFVQQSGGSVDIKSEVGRGTAVTLLLRRTYKDRSEGVLEEAVPLTSLQASRILVVEDNLQVAESAIALLRELGHQVEHCASAHDALRFLERDAQFDVIFSDLVMPGGMDGLDLARIVRERWPAIPILLATGYSDSVERAAREGFPILNKPYHPAELERELRRLIPQASNGSNVLPLRSRQA